MSHNHQAHREKAGAALSSVLWSLFLTGIKVWAGMATNSLGILSEALHSGLDFCAAAMTFYAVKVAAIPPDKDHPYGHEKVENLSALVETALLVVTSVWIIWEAANRIFYTSAEIQLTWWAFAVVAVSLVVDINRSAMLRRVAKKHKSQALEADALHFTTDIWSSAVVLVGLVCVWFAGFSEEGTLLNKILHRADAVAALFVAAIILRVSWGLSKRAIHSLMDGSSTEMTETVSKVLAEQLPSYPVLAIRLRDVGAKVFIELTVGMPSHLHVDDAHALTERVEAVIHSVIPEADILTHVEPTDFLDTHSDDELAHHIALRHDMRIHGFNLLQTAKGKLLKIDVELPDDKTLNGISAEMASFEEELKKALRLYKLIVRIEPMRRAIIPTATSDGANLTKPLIEEKVSRTIAEYPEILNVVSIDTEDVKETNSISVYCTVPGDMSVLNCHELASRVEHSLHHVLPTFSEIVVVLQPEN